MILLARPPTTWETSIELGPDSLLSSSYHQSPLAHAALLMASEPVPYAWGSLVVKARLPAHRNRNRFCLRPLRGHFDHAFVMTSLL